MNEKFLEKYVNSYSPSGSEMLAQQVWLDEIKEHVDEIDVESYGNVIAKINGKSTPPPLWKEESIEGESFSYIPGKNKSVLLESHVDEVSYRISLITENGLIYVIKNGNADHQVAPSSRVKIHTEKGLVDGVFGWPAIHTRSASEEKEIKPTIENIFIDCGVDSKKELTKLGVKVGCLVTYPPNFEIVGNYYTGKGLDNKIGGYILSEVIKKFKDDEGIPKFFANVVQEEVGLRGAHMICQTYRPDFAIVIDVTHDTTTPMINKKKSGVTSCGKGPIIPMGPVIHPKFVKFIYEIADKNKIRFQRKSLGRATGTDADNYASHGIVTALISIPMRYMHTKVEMVHARDVEKTIELIYHVMSNLNNDSGFSLLTK